MTQSIGFSYLVHVPKAPLKRPWLSANDRDHWGRRRGLTEHYRTKTAELVRAAHGDRPPADFLHVIAILAFGDEKRRDPHNYILTAKACVDGIVDAGVVFDDNSKHVIGPDMRRNEKLDEGIWLRITEIGKLEDW